jgi:hypothetical protein
MPRKTISKTRARPKSPRTKLTENVSYEKGFHFYTVIDNYTGITATNLTEFTAKLQAVPIESIVFHFQRKDFQKWITETIGDKELAERISIFGRAFHAEDLRKEIVRIVQERLTESNKLVTLIEVDQSKVAVPIRN